MNAVEQVRARMLVVLADAHADGREHRAVTDAVADADALVMPLVEALAAQAARPVLPDVTMMLTWLLAPALCWLAIAAALVELVRAR